MQKKNLSARTLVQASMGKSARIKRERAAGERKHESKWDKLPAGMMLVIPTLAEHRATGNKPVVVPLPTRTRIKGVKRPSKQPVKARTAGNIKNLIKQLMNHGKASQTKTVESQAQVQSGVPGSVA
jgi:hypothetical protein